MLSPCRCRLPFRCASAAPAHVLQSRCKSFHCLMPQHAYTVAAARPPSSRNSSRLQVVDSLRAQTGHVVVPVDTTGRVLEVLLALEHHWSAQRLAYPIVFLCKTGQSVVAKARAQLEFLSDKVQQARTALCTTLIVQVAMRMLSEPSRPK